MKGVKKRQLLAYVFSEDSEKRTSVDFALFFTEFVLRTFEDYLEFYLFFACHVIPIKNTDEYQILGYSPPLNQL